jgi:excisionase family DNA binding protein
MYREYAVTTETHESQRLLTIPEVAAALRVSRGTVYRLVRVGRIPALRLGADGGSFRIPEDQLERALTVTGKDESMTRDGRTN